VHCRFKCSLLILRHRPQRGMATPFCPCPLLRQSFGISLWNAYFSQLSGVVESEPSQLPYKETTYIRSDEGRSSFARLLYPGQKLPVGYLMRAISANSLCGTYLHARYTQVDSGKLHYSSMMLLYLQFLDDASPGFKTCPVFHRRLRM
jgi:hypothetical protein